MVKSPASRDQKQIAVLWGGKNSGYKCLQENIYGEKIFHFYVFWDKISILTKIRKFTFNSNMNLFLRPG